MKAKTAIPAVLASLALAAGAEVFADGFFKNLMNSETIRASIANTDAAKEYSQIRNLIERVNEIPKDPRAFCEKYATRENLDRAVDKIREIDVSACEEDVKAAKEEIVKSGEKLSETLAKMPKAAPDKNAALSALASSLLGGKSSGGSNFAEELGECLKQFNESAAKLAGGPPGGRARRRFFARGRGRPNICWKLRARRRKTLP